MSKKYLDLDGVSHLKAKFDSSYVAQETGKGLSSNDYTSTEKNKLSGIAQGAQVNVIESITINGVSATISGKTASMTIPTGDSQVLALEYGESYNQGDILTALASGVIVVVVEYDESFNPHLYRCVGIGSNNKLEFNSIENGVVCTVYYNASSGWSHDTQTLVTDNNYVHTDVNFTSAKDTKLTGIATGAEVNKIDKIKVNGTEQTITSKAVDITVPTNNNQLTNGAGYQNASQVETAINSKISSTYKPKGSVAFANLPSLTSSNEGNVYNVTDAFTTTSDFVEGAGKSYPAGTNVVIVNVDSSTYKYDVLSGFVDLSAYQLSAELVAITNNEIDTLFA